MFYKNNQTANLHSGPCGYGLSWPTLDGCVKLKEKKMRRKVWKIPRTRHTDRWHYFLIMLHDETGYTFSHFTFANILIDMVSGRRVRLLVTAMTYLIFWKIIWLHRKSLFQEKHFTHLTSLSFVGFVWLYWQLERARNQVFLFMAK